MRYLIQLLIPVLIVAGAIYLAIDNRRNSRQEEGAEGSDKAMFALILAVGALVTIAVIFFTQSYWVGTA